MFVCMFPVQNLEFGEPVPGGPVVASVRAWSNKCHETVLTRKLSCHFASSTLGFGMLNFGIWDAQLWDLGCFSKNQNGKRSFDWKA